MASYRTTTSYGRAHALTETEPASLGASSAGFGPSGPSSSGIGEANGAGRTALIAQYYDSAEARYEFSGNQNVDAVLIGSRWTLKQFTYSFPTSGAFYADQGYAAGSEPSKQIPFNAQQQAAVRYAYSLISGYTGLVFTEVTETATTHADFRFSQTDHDEKVPSAYANFPSSSEQAGDVWFGKTDQPFYETPAIGNWGMSTMLHEMGHTMGLKHGHSDYTEIDLSEGNIDSPPGGGPRYGSVDLAENRDGQDWSLMTYRPDPTDLGPGEETQFEADGFNQPQTYMQYDIAALQYLYGANFNHNGGNTTYSWSPTTGRMSINGVAQQAPTANKILMTLWDGNGTDTYDLSNYSTNLDINLQPGEFSTFSAQQLVNHQPENGYAPSIGNVANALLYRGDARSLIENAIGGSGDDRIVGNVGANLLRGGAAGSDLLVGDAGNDRLYGEAEADTLYGDGKRGGDSGIGFGTGTFDKNYGHGNFSMANAVDLTNMFSLAPHGNIHDSFRTPHVTVNALSGGSFDYYKVTLNAGSTITLDTDMGSLCDTMIFLLDAGGNVLAFNNDSAITDGAEGSFATVDSFLTHQVGRTGVYYIAVGEHYSDTQAQPFADFSWYELQVSVAGQPTLGGGTGNDLLDGGAGADTLIGGKGNDTYVVDNAGDRITEAAAAGTDTVQSSITYRLGGTLENLVLTGTTAINGTGNSSANQLTGNAAVNSLSGGDGNDLLNGGAGGDGMRGGGGNDFYVVDNAGDRARESLNEGVDSVRSTVSFVLPSHIERLTLVGTAGSGVGNDLGNTLVGNASANTLSGRDGRDSLTGGAGDDRFLFNTALESAPNRDEITDFLVADDTIVLDRTIFTAITANGRLSEAAFVTGSAAADGSDRIIYERTTGNLYYDPDGTGAAAKVLFAHLDPGLLLTHADFSAIA
jgi:serralysin